MRVVFISNYLSHHQMPVCYAINKKVKGNFCFIETEPMDQYRIALGWQKEKTDEIEVVKNYIDEEAYQLAAKRIEEADVVIIGGTRDEFIIERLKKNKLIFRYEERIFKKTWLKIFDPRVLHMIYVTHIKNQKKKVYMLCASAYLPQELKLLHLYKNKMFKWGYFPETYYYNMDELMKKKEHEVVEILWCARFIDWKHPEKVIAVAEKLACGNLKFHITMLGDGELKEIIKRKISKKNLDIYISVPGAIPAKEVRNYMETANIFLATSDRNEGWGVVVNEAMNSGCAVVANRMMGAVPWLIRNGENGYAYKNDKECISCLNILIKDEKKRKQLGINAYKTIKGQWNAEKAAENLLTIMEGVLKKDILNITSVGVGSMAL